MTKYKICSRCKTRYQVRFFFKNKLSKDGLTPECKKCNYQKTKNWRKRNWDKFLETSRKLSKKYRENGDLIEKNRLYKKNNYQRIREKAKIRSKEIKSIVLSKYSNGKPKCNCCGELEILFLSIDHINNDGAEHRKKIGGSGTTMYYWLIRNNFPTGFQVLCFNCNQGKRILGVCPHKLKSIKNKLKVID